MTSPRILLSPPHLGDQEAGLVMAALAANWVAPAGPDLALFEGAVAQYVGRAHAVALSSGTAALHLALVAQDIGPGDAVLVPTLTFAATANAVRYTGAVPVFVDCDPATWAIDPDLVDRALRTGAGAGRRIKAVLPVDLYGQCADYQRLGESCDRYGARLVSDAAEGLGASYAGRPAGSFGVAAALSFNGNKIITTGGGGMLVTDVQALADRVRYLSTQARDPVLHYEHRVVGYNYRLSNLLAAVGRGQMAVLPERVAARRTINDTYRAALQEVPGIEFMPCAAYGEPSYWLTCLQIDPELFGATRDDVCRALDRQNIESRPAWKPMHLQPAFQGFPNLGGVAAEAVFARGLCLPSG